MLRKVVTLLVLHAVHRVLYVEYQLKRTEIFYFTANFQHGTHGKQLNRKIVWHPPRLNCERILINIHLRRSAENLLFSVGG